MLVQSHEMGLVLTRKLGERVAVRHKGEIVGWVTLCESRGNKSRIGLKFSPEFELLREEVLIAMGMPVETQAISLTQPEHAAA